MAGVDVSLMQAWLLRMGLVYLLLTGALGVGFTVRPGWVGVLGPTHAHLGLVGFFLSTVMGVAFWMMPRPGGLRQGGWEAAVFVLLNAGMVARIVGEPWARLGGGVLAHAVFVASGVLMLGAMACFAWAMSRRVVTRETLWRRGRAARAAAGDRRGGAGGGAAGAGTGNRAGPAPARAPGEGKPPDAVSPEAEADAGSGAGGA